jgi:hypothetical protein
LARQHRLLGLVGVPTHEQLSQFENRHDRERGAGDERPAGGREVGRPERALEEWDVEHEREQDDLPGAQESERDDHDDDDQRHAGEDDTTTALPRPWVTVVPA